GWTHPSSAGSLGRCSRFSLVCGAVCCPRPFGSVRCPPGGPFFVFPAVPPRGGKRMQKSCMSCYVHLGWRRSQGLEGPKRGRTTRCDGHFRTTPTRRHRARLVSGPPSDGPCLEFRDQLLRQRTVSPPPAVVPAHPAPRFSS